MNLKKQVYKVILWFTPAIMACVTWGVNAQTEAGISPRVYFSDKDGVQHELKIEDDYLILSVYETSPAKFVKTIGGFYTMNDDVLIVQLEFNSDYENDALREIEIPYSSKNGDLVLHLPDEVNFGIAAPAYTQDLDGAWLFATRGPDKGQERRDDSNSRKTLKFLLHGRFQWIAYNTETFKFYGTGGGSFVSQKGQYVENIEYFSRDDSRVGATLQFDYKLVDGDWHHKGKNSKGEPMYEIWAKR